MLFAANSSDGSGWLMTDRTTSCGYLTCIFIVIDGVLLKMHSAFVCKIK